MLEVLRVAGGPPDEQMTASLRTVVAQNGQIARPPTVAELEFLKHPRKDEDYSQRDRIR